LVPFWSPSITKTHLFVDYSAFNVMSLRDATWFRLSRVCSELSSKLVCYLESGNPEIGGIPIEPKSARPTNWPYLRNLLILARSDSASFGVPTFCVSIKFRAPLEHVEVTKARQSLVQIDD